MSVLESPQTLVSIEGVFSSPASMPCSVEGVLTLSKSTHDAAESMTIAWRPIAAFTSEISCESDATQIETRRSSLDGWEMPLSEITSIHRTTDPFERPQVLIHLTDGEEIPALHFYKGGHLQLFAILDSHFTRASSTLPTSLLFLSKSQTSTPSSSLGTTPERSFYKPPKICPKSPHKAEKPHKMVHSIPKKRFQFWWEITVDIDFSDLLDDHQTFEEQSPNGIPDGIYVSESDDDKSSLESDDESDGCLSDSLLEHRCLVAESFWEGCMDEVGVIHAAEKAEILDRIFHESLHPFLRKKVWPFLLGFFPFDSTFEQRKQIEANYREQYATLVRQWSSLLPDQEKNLGSWRADVRQIDKDVQRTDRTRPCFLRDDSRALVQMSNILKSYCIFNLKIGYVQGMSDLVAPLLEVLEDEALTFWCFKLWMDEMEGYFNPHSKLLEETWLTIGRLMEFLDHELYCYLEGASIQNMLFMYRWMVLAFKREFQYEYVLRLWEIMWTKQKGRHYSLFICLAITLRERGKVMTNQFMAHDVLKHMSDLAGKLDLTSVLADADFLHLQVYKYGGCDLQAYLA